MSQDGDICIGFLIIFHNNVYMREFFMAQMGGRAQSPGHRSLYNVNLAISLSISVPSLSFMAQRLAFGKCFMAPFNEINKILRGKNRRSGGICPCRFKKHPTSNWHVYYFKIYDSCKSHSNNFLHNVFSTYMYDFISNAV